MRAPLCRKLRPIRRRPALDIHDILKILPHRYPFLLIDRVLDY